MTLKQVAEAAGVHYSTVSRALNPATRQLVKPNIAARVLRSAEELGYRTNALASGLRSGRSHVVGMVVPDLSSLLFPPILEGVESTLLKEGYMTIVANSANDSERHRRILAGMMERQVDGLILATATLRDDAPDAIALRTPVVLLNRTDESGRAPAVLNDDIRGIGLAVKHVAALGHRNIAHIAGPQWLSTGRARLRGFNLAIGEVGAKGIKPEVIEAKAFTRQAGHVACIALLSSRTDISAIVAANDLLALGCYDAFAERNIVCPRDISVTGYNDAPFMDMVSPPLTTVRIRQKDLGIEAARLLLARMNGQTLASDVLLRPEFVQRASTARFLTPALSSRF